jgi:ectoine hydroxylase-related dioxygenase (phytanoyl-CoA dioxygenase family)
MAVAMPSVDADMPPPGQPSGAALPEADIVSALVEQIALRGAAVMPNVLSLSSVKELAGQLDRAYRRQCDELGGEAALKALNDADVMRCPLVYHDSFLALAQQPAIIDVAKRLLGEHVVLIMQNGVINRPGQIHAQTRWHRDLNHQYWVSSAPLALSALVCLDDFTADNGATRFLPASHLAAAFPPADVVDGSATTVTAAAGSIIFMNAMTFHCAGRNRSYSVRRAINHVIGVPILAQAIDLPAALARTPPTDPWIAGYLGYRWNPAPDAREWRLRKQMKTESKIIEPDE